MTDGGVKGLNDLIEWFGRDDTKTFYSYWTNRHATPALRIGCRRSSGEA
jgi:hypothetical protein